VVEMVAAAAVAAETAETIQDIRAKSLYIAMIIITTLGST